MAPTVLTISSRNYSSWSLRGWLLCRLAGLEVEEQMISIDDPNNRAELLLLSPSVLVPRLTHQGSSVWDTLAIAEYLNELYPEARMYPADPKARYTFIECLSNIHNVNGRPKQLNKDDPDFVDFYGRPWAQVWDKYFEQGWDKPADNLMPEDVLKSLQ